MSDTDGLNSSIHKPPPVPSADPSAKTEGDMLREPSPTSPAAVKEPLPSATSHLQPATGSSFSIDRAASGSRAPQQRDVPGIGGAFPGKGSIVDDMYSESGTTTATGARNNAAKEKTHRRRKRLDGSNAKNGNGRRSRGDYVSDAALDSEAAGGGKRKKPSWGRRFARVRWAALMWLPMMLLFLHRSERFAVDTDNRITAQSTLGVYSLLVLFIVINEFSDGVHWPYYGLSLLTGIIWGSAISTLADLTAARLVVVLLFGISAGQLRYHWDVKKIKRSLRGGSSRQSGASGPGSDGGTLSSNAHGTAADAKNTSSSQCTPHSRSRAASNATFLQRTASKSHYLANLFSRFTALLHRFLYFLARSVGMGPWLMVGELIGCALLVPDGWQTILSSWYGYVVLCVFPVLAYKVSSYVSHFVIMVLGSRVHTADASRLLYLKWLVTTILSLAIHCVGIAYLLMNLVPYVWSLQLLMCPYCVVVEVVSWESRHQQNANPYKEVAESYAEHINYIKSRKEEYLK